MLQSRGASIALYMSIWLGIIVVGVLLGGTTLISHIQDITDIGMNPISGILSLITNSFSDARFLAIAAIILAFSGFLGVLTGNNFAVIYAVPFVMIMGLTNLFIIPTSLVTGEQFGNETISIITDTSSPTLQTMQILFMIFLGILTVLTVYTFVTGRN